MKSNDKKKIERYRFCNLIILGILLSVSAFGVFAQPSNSSENFCNEQAIKFREKETKSVSLFNKSKKGWQSDGKIYPSNSKRKYKKNDIFVLRDEREALRLVEEMLKNGEAEDNFLKSFQWDRYENDVLFAFKYIKLCRQEDFQGLYRSLGQQRRQTYQRLERIKTLSKKVEEIYKNDEAAFKEAYGSPTTLLELLARSNPRSIPSIIKNLLESAIGSLEISEMTDLLPRILERFEVLTYLKGGLLKRYEFHLNMQDQILENLGDAYFERDCKKCKKLSCIQIQDITGNVKISSAQNGATVINEFDFTVSFDSVPEGVEVWSYTFPPLSKRFYFFPIDKKGKTSGSFTMKIKVTPSGDGYTFDRGVFLADECTSNEIRKKISGTIKREINGESKNGTVYGPLNSLPKGVKVLQNIKEKRLLKK